MKLMIDTYEFWADGFVFVLFGVLFIFFSQKEIV